LIADSVGAHQPTRARQALETIQATVKEVADICAFMSTRPRNPSGSNIKTAKALGLEVPPSPLAPTR
jgi:hypothetical protein